MIGNIHYGGTAYVFGTKFNFFGWSPIANQDLEVTGEWKSSEVVEGSYKLGHADAKAFRAQYVPPASGGGPNRPGGSSAPSYHPTLGTYRVRVGHSADLTFRYSDHIHSQVSNFTDTSHPAVFYSGRAFVHHGRFSWTGHTASRRELHVRGHWTSARTVAGVIRDGVATRNFHATLDSS